jgi:hypothetical protein
MNVADAVELLINSGIEVRIMGDGIVGTNPENIFGIYKEDSVWILNYSGVGQLSTIIRLSTELETVTDAAINFSKLKSQCRDNSISLIYAIWELQKTGLAAQIHSDTDIHIRSTTTFEVDSVYYFMLDTVNLVLADNPYEMKLRWLSDKQEWLISGHLSNGEAVETYSENLLNAIEIIKKLPR